ncbi:MAG: hypothetical protein WB682_10240 [Candidatus Dormiibacterota bacterium]
MIAPASPALKSSRYCTNVFLHVVVFLAFCLVGQAVHAKESHYAGKSPQSALFSASVKIANLAHLVPPLPDVPAVVPYVLVIRELRPSQTIIFFTPPTEKPARPITSRLLRSPPDSL